MLIPLIVASVLIITFLSVFVIPGIALVRDNQVGIVTRKMSGKKMAEGQIIARNGEIGIQAQTLMPGLYYKFPIIWKIKKADVIDINPNEIGIVESVDGDVLPKGRLLGDEVECNSFQDAKAFLTNNGKKGPQIAILKPGTYRINIAVFSIKKHHVINVEEDTIGIVMAADGLSLPPGFVIAPKAVEAKEHKFFQDGQSFINNNGYRGPQLDTLQPGQYYINPLLFNVKLVPVAEVPPGYVAILRSNVGQELEKQNTIPTSTDIKPDLSQPVHESIESVLITNKNTRGIWNQPIAPGKYNLNTIAFTPYLVPTSAVTIDWASGSEVRSNILGSAPKSKSIDNRPETEKATEFFKFSQLKVTSKDGFQLEVDVRMVIRIRPDNAAFIIARFGSVENLIEQIVHPLIDSSFRNKAGEEKAIEFVLGRTALQRDALERARKEFSQYNVEAQNLLIAYIAVDKDLLATQTKKEIALQQQEQYKEEAKARQEEINVEEKKARAIKQKDVVEAKLEIAIKTDKAEARRKEAEGERDYIQFIADGNAHREKTVGEAIAKAYEAQAAALGGAGPVAVVKLMQEISSGNVKITPDVLVTSGQDGQGNGLVNALLAMLLTQNKEIKKSK